MVNHIVWVDIPVTNLARATKFYEKILKVAIEPIPGMQAAAFKHDEGVSGCLVEDHQMQPSAQGPLVYLNASGRMDEALAAVAELGGKIIQDKHSIAPYGTRAIIIDSEGNKVALHSL